MKTTMIALILATVIPMSLADETRTARVAAALADGGCGKCRTDLDACRAESLATGKPLVLFVGGCDGRASDGAGTASIPCRVPQYTGDGRPGAEKRIVILGPTVGEAKLTIWQTLPGGAPAGDVAAAVRLAAPARLDWHFGER